MDFLLQRSLNMIFQRLSWILWNTSRGKSRVCVKRELGMSWTNLCLHLRLVMSEYIFLFRGQPILPTYLCIPQTLEGVWDHPSWKNYFTIIINLHNSVRLLKVKITTLIVKLVRFCYRYTYIKCHTSYPTSYIVKNKSVCKSYSKEFQRLTSNKKCFVLQAFL